jgi:hypothetical protein
LEELKPAIKQSQISQQHNGLGYSGDAFINKNTGKPTYSKGYARKKGKISPIDLDDKGDFQREIFVDIRENTFVIDSANEKTEKLLAQFSGDIFGLNKETKTDLKPTGQKVLKKQFENKL